MMNSSKIVLLAALAAVSVASPVFANAVDRAAQQGVHIYNMVPSDQMAGGYDPSIKTQR